MPSKANNKSQFIDPRVAPAKSIRPKKERPTPQQKVETNKNFVSVATLECEEEASKQVEWFVRNNSPSMVLLLDTQKILGVSTGRHTQMRIDELSPLVKHRHWERFLAWCIGHASLTVDMITLLAQALALRGGCVQEHAVLLRPLPGCECITLNTHNNQLFTLDVTVRTPGFDVLLCRGGPTDPPAALSTVPRPSWKKMLTIKGGVVPSKEKNYVCPGTTRACWTASVPGLVPVGGGGYLNDDDRLQLEPMQRELLSSVVLRPVDFLNNEAAKFVLDSRFDKCAMDMRQCLRPKFDKIVYACDESKHREAAFCRDDANATLISKMTKCATGIINHSHNANTTKAMEYLANKWPEFILSIITERVM